MVRKPVSVKFLSEKGESEKEYFAKSDEIKLREFRKMVAIEAKKKKKQTKNTLKNTSITVSGVVKIKVCFQQQKRPSYLYSNSSDP